MINQIDDILIEIERVLFLHQDNCRELNISEKPNYSVDGLRASIKIFSSYMLDHMYNLNEKEHLSLNDRCRMATSLGDEIRKIVKIYTDIDTHKLY